LLLRGRLRSHGGGLLRRCSQRGRPLTVMVMHCRYDRTKMYNLSVGMPYYAVGGQGIRMHNADTWLGRTWRAIKRILRFEPPRGAEALPGQPIPLTRTQRLTEYFNRLRQQPASHSAEEALIRLSQTLTEVEDELSGIPRQEPPPPPNRPDGRMYPPQADNIRRLPDGSITARTAGHRIEIGADGSITIRNIRTGDIDFHQPGAGGGN
jgi:hypothetical protein